MLSTYAKYFYMILDYMSGFVDTFFNTSIADLVGEVEGLGFVGDVASYLVSYTFIGEMSLFVLILSSGIGVSLAITIIKWLIDIIL